MAKRRERMDCHQLLSEDPCDMAILGDEEQLLKYAVQHAVLDYGLRDTPALRNELRTLVHEEREKLKAA